jgi:2-polyprenyl-6-methoxyphenol hydroxylase-like FAD-dependent oxidoreductase
VLKSGGQRVTVTAAYVLGAGGGHSVTRHSMHEHLDGETRRSLFRCRRKDPPGLSAGMWAPYRGAGRICLALAVAG